MYQAVPELPTQIALSIIAQRVFVLLATVPLGSRAIIFPILPLMVAGCEATKTEDRDWVRGRWKDLSVGNSSGVVDRCLELTSEIWRRRDNYREGFESYRPPHNGTEVSSFPLPRPETANLLGSDLRNPNGSGVKDICHSAFGHQACTESSVRWPSTNFAYQQGFRTGAECSLEVTVNSRLHWLGVMKEWGWEGKK